MSEPTKEDTGGGGDVLERSTTGRENQDCWSPPEPTASDYDGDVSRVTESKEDVEKDEGKKSDGDEYFSDIYNLSRKGDCWYIPTIYINHSRSLECYHQDTHQNSDEEGKKSTHISEAVWPIHGNDDANETTCDEPIDDLEQGYDYEECDKSTETTDDIDNGSLIELCIPYSNRKLNGCELSPLEMAPNRINDKMSGPTDAEYGTVTSFIDTNMEGNTEDISTKMKHDQALTRSVCPHHISLLVFWRFLACTILLVALTLSFQCLFTCCISLYRIRDATQSGFIEGYKNETNRTFIPEGYGVNDSFESLELTYGNDVANDTTCDVPIDETGWGFCYKNQDEGTLSDEAMGLTDDRSIRISMRDTNQNRSLEWHSQENHDNFVEERYCSNDILKAVETGLGFCYKKQNDSTLSDETTENFDDQSIRVSIRDTNQSRTLEGHLQDIHHNFVEEGYCSNDILKAFEPTYGSDYASYTTCDVPMYETGRGFCYKRQDENTLRDEAIEISDPIGNEPLIEQGIPESIGLNRLEMSFPLQKCQNQTRDEILGQTDAEYVSSMQDVVTPFNDIDMEENAEQNRIRLKCFNRKDKSVPTTGTLRHVSLFTVRRIILACTFLVYLIPSIQSFFISCIGVYSIKIFFNTELTWSKKKVFMFLRVLVFTNVLSKIKKHRFEVCISGSYFVNDQNKKSELASKTISGEISVKANLSKLPGFVFNFRDSNALHNAFVYPVSEPGDYHSMSEQGNPVCTCTDDSNDLENSLMDTSLDHNSLEENDTNRPDRESPSPASLPESSNEHPNDANETELQNVIGDSGYTTQPVSSLRRNSQRSGSSTLSNLTNVIYGNVLEDPYHPRALIAPRDTLALLEMNSNQTLFFMLLIGNVIYGTKEDLLARLPSQTYGGIILDQGFDGYVEQNRFQRTLQYDIIEELYHASLCITKKDGTKFIMKTIPRGRLNVHQLQRYLMAAERIRSFVPRILGVLFDNSDIKILFSYRKGHSLEKMMQMGRFIEGLDLARFITYLVEAVQTLHREGISLLSINPSSITLDDDHNLASFQITKIQFTETSQQLSADYPTYAPFGGDITGNTEDRKSYDMFSLGALFFYLISKGRELWHGVTPAERHADNIYKRIISLDQTRHFVNPYVVHLILCLMNPNQHARLTAETVSQHVFFANENDAMTSLQLVNTHGHGCPCWVVTITDGSQVIYVTTARDRSPLHEIFSDRRLREMIGHNSEQAWFTHVTQENAIPIKSDMVIDIRMRRQ